jgi:hypothetical protein
VTSRARKIVLGCAGAIVLVVCAVGIAAWWMLRGGPVVDRLDLVGPETQAFVTFLAVPEDGALRSVVDSLERRADAKTRDRHGEWLHSLNDLLSSARLSHVRASATVEALPDGQNDVGVVVSLGRMANLVRMLVGIADSEREIRIYRKHRIMLGREKQDYAMAFVGNNLILSRNPSVIMLLIDRIEAATASSGVLSEKMEAVLEDIDPEQQMPGYGALVNDKASLASIWRLVTDAPPGSEIVLPEEFEGAGFRFGFVSADAVRGDGYFYFHDEEAAAGSVPQIEDAIMRTFARYHLKPRVEIEQEGSRLRVNVEAGGLQAGIDRYFAKGFD